MAELDLVSDAGLQKACEQVEQLYRENETTKTWTKDLATFLTWVANADEKTRGTLDFQRRLWNENPVSGVGQGNISVENALADGEFRKWLAKRSLEPLPEDKDARTAALSTTYEEIIQKLESKTDRTAHLKVFRVLAALHPRDFTTIAHRRKLFNLVRRMGGDTKDPVEAHAYVSRRLEQVLGSSGNSPSDQAWRMEIPWYLYERLDAETPEAERVERAGVTAGEETLAPLPAARRRRGMTAIQGGLSTVLGILEFCKAGVTRDDLLDQIHATMPGLQESSRRTVINVLQGELGVLKREGDSYRLTEQGSALLESEDSSELSNWLLTRILGVDHLLKSLQQTARNRGEVTDLLQRVNPGWTTTFAPSAMINWMVSFGAVVRNNDGRLSLTPLGKSWAERISWEPEFLKADQAQTIVPTPAASEGGLSLPSVDQICSHVQKFGDFPRSIIERLHIGLWAKHSVGGSHHRHFAVLTGISGSGKTLLARRYGEAVGGGSADAAERVLIEAVQPGWYDPTALLGFLNPLRGDAYSRTRFLNFLMRAAQDPGRPYVAILDEMNLSHPEQYLAPLLSAMETGADIPLHGEQDQYDGVPPSLPYPPNLALIGTVNMDETTHGISDKVLDRAFTMEFWSIDLNAYPRWGKRGIPADREQEIRALLTALTAALSPARMHFGWRVVDDILNYVHTATALAPKAALDECLDSVIYAKVLPKLRGDDNQRFRKALEEAGAVCLKHDLKQSASKLTELLRDLKETGSARFWR